MKSNYIPARLAFFWLLAITLSAGAFAASDCRQGIDAHVWTAPLKPLPGERLRVMAVATDAGLTEIRVIDPAGRQSKVPAVKGGGPPWSLRGMVSRLSRGTYRIEAHRAGRVRACTEVTIGRGSGNRGSGRWDFETQALYAAWIEHLFDAPSEQSLSFPSLEPVLRDPGRNFLYDYLKEGEDRRLPAEPDCADLPYILRAYFAWKLGLPQAFLGRDLPVRSDPERRTGLQNRPSAGPDRS